MDTPHHYTQGTYEPLNVMEAWSTPGEYRGFLKLTVLKYINRYQKKHGLLDLAKAKDYLEKLIAYEEKEAGIPPF